MSLIAHWPLNGNTNDISGNGYVLTNGGAIDSSFGKIGHSYLFSTQGMSVSSIPLLTNINLYELTLSAWVYATETPTSNGNNIITLSQNTGIRFRLDPVNRIWVYYYNGTNTFSFTSSAIELNEWTHITLLLRDEELSIYLNGIKNASSLASSSIYISSGGSAQIGQYNAGSEVWKGYINDVRIYDTALTDMEIQEIARAKILHYTFDDMQEPTTNYANTEIARTLTIHNCTATFSDEPVRGDSWKKVTITETSTNSRLLKFPYLTQPSNTTRTYSLEIDMNDTTGYFWRVDGFNGGVHDDTTITGKVSLSQTTTDTGGTLALFLCNNTLSMTGISDTIYYRYYQVEEKDHSTEFTEDSRTGLVRDSSGFYNDAPLTEATTPQWTTDSKIGAGGYYFNGVGTPMNIIDVDAPFSAALNNYTIAFWARHDDAGTGNMPIASRTNTNFYWYGDNSWMYVHGVSAEFYYPKSVSIPTGTWGHFCVTYDGANVNIYRNGVYEGSQASTGTANFSDGFRIGNWASSSTYQMDGGIDDVRIYATALSATDILDLYETRAEIEESGVLYAKDFLSDCEETENIIFYENAVAQDSYTPYVFTTEGTWQTNHPNAIRAYNKNGNEITGYINTGVTDWTNTIHAVWEYDSILDKPVVVMNDAAGTSPWMSKHFPITRIPKTLTQIGLNYGDKYTLSWLQWADNISGGPFVGLYGLDLSATTGFHDGTEYVYNTEPKKWQRVSVTFTVNTIRDLNSTSNLNFYFYGHNSNTVIKIADVQLDLKDHATPFTDSYRSAIQLPSTIEFKANEVHETGTANYQDFSTVGITDGLIGYWPLEKDTRDVSGENRNATALGPILQQNSYYFDGVNDTLNFGTGDTFFPVYSHTISVMFRSDGITATTGTSPALFGFTYGIKGFIGSDGHPNYTLYKTGFSASVSASDGYNYHDGQWHLYTATCDGVTMKLYLDSVYQGTANASAFWDGYTSWPTNSWNLGKDNNNYMYYFRGNMKQHKLFNRALTQEEIRIEYNTMLNNEVQIDENGTVYAKDFIQY